MAQASVGIAQLKHVPVFLFYNRKPLCLFVSWCLRGEQW